MSRQCAGSWWPNASILPLLKCEVEIRLPSSYSHIFTYMGRYAPLSGISVTWPWSAMVAAVFQIALALMSSSRHRASGTSGHFGTSLVRCMNSKVTQIALITPQGWGYIPEVLGLLRISSTVDTAYSILQGITTKSNYGYGPTWRPNGQIS